MNQKRFRAFYFFLIGLLLVGSSHPAFSVEIIPRSQYLAYARASADWVWEHYDEVIEKWKSCSERP